MPCGRPQRAITHDVQVHYHSFRLQVKATNMHGRYGNRIRGQCDFCLSIYDYNFSRPQFLLKTYFKPSGSMRHGEGKERAVGLIALCRFSYIIVSGWNSTVFI